MKKEDLEQLSVYEAEKEIRTYLNDLYVHRPIKPKLKSQTPTEEELTTYVTQTQEYEVALKEYETNNDFYNSESKRLYDILDDIIREDSGLNDIPEEYRSKVYIHAYRQGHSGGYSEVYNCLCNLVEIFY